MPRRFTDPPRMLPLIPIVVVALIVGDRAIAIVAGVFTLIGFNGEFVLLGDLAYVRGTAAAELLLNLVFFVCASITLQVLVRWWVRVAR
jgi:hypothetical protein